MPSRLHVLGAEKGEQGHSPDEHQYVVHEKSQSPIQDSGFRDGIGSTFVAYAAN